MGSFDKDNPECFTIGHSNHEMGHFLDLLRRYKINCLVDVRTSPYSKFVQQFNKEILASELRRKNFLYVYMGNKIGGKYSEPALLYPNGTVNYNKVSQRDVFRAGIENVVRNIEKSLRIALMCAEKNPFDCHRFMLVSRALSHKGVRVRHILEDGETVSNGDLENQLLQKYKSEFDQLSLFQESLPPEKILDEAYRRWNQEAGFVAEKIMDQE